MKIALIGEGKNDIGIESRMGEWKEGAVQPLIRKFIAKPEFQILRFKKAESKFKVPSNKIPRFGMRAAKLRYFLGELASLNGSIDLLIFFQDLDKQDSGKASEIEAKRAFREAMEDVQEAFAYINDRWQLPAIAMLPMLMLENWLLADATAFERTFGSNPTKPRLPKEPEFIWGDEQDRTSDHPKNYIQRVMEQYGEDASTENFILIAEASSVAEMRKRLPHSFAPFAEKMERFAARQA